MCLSVILCSKQRGSSRDFSDHCKSSLETISKIYFHSS